MGNSEVLKTINRNVAKQLNMKQEMQMTTQVGNIVEVIIAQLATQELQI